MKYVLTDRGIVGTVYGNSRGFRFLPWTQQGPSRKHWDTPYDCLPRWCRNVATIIEADDPNQALKKYATGRKAMTTKPATPLLVGGKGRATFKAVAYVNNEM